MTLSTFYKIGNYIGRALHLIEDSFTPSHTERDTKTWEIIQFYNYDKQDKEWHEKMDEINEITKPYYYRAKGYVIKVLELIFDTKKKNIHGELTRLLEEILKLKNGG